VLLLGVAALVTSQVVIMQRPLTNLGLSTGVGYGTAEPTIANAGSGPIDGELFVVRNAGTADPDLKVYSQFAGAWMTAIMGGGTDPVTLTTDITFGNNDEDDFPFNGPVTFNVRRESFDFQAAEQVEEDYTAAVVTDVGENYLILHGSQIPLIWYSHELAFGGTSTPFSAAGALDTSGMVDVTTQEGLDFRFGGDPLKAIWFDEDNSASTYCEIGLTIGTIANIDTLYFGWHLAEARTAFDGGAHNTMNTYAVFTVQDVAGDLDIETELNGGGTLLDEIAGNVWTDGETNVMRVTLLADSVTFTLDGTAVPQVTAVLNLDATDRMVCGFGYKQSAAAADANIMLEYVEIGVAQ
jgi:hypothetical protein